MLEKIKVANGKELREELLRISTVNGNQVVKLTTHFEWYHLLVQLKEDTYRYLLDDFSVADYNQPQPFNKIVEIGEEDYETVTIEILW